MNLFRSFVLILGCLLAIALVGCQEPKYYPVTGQLLDESGQPFTELAGAPVSFESTVEPVSAVAEVRADGSFTMTTETPNDGCLPGEHRVTVGRVFFAADAPAPRVIDPKYDSFDTSGLTATVEKTNNHLEFKLPRLKKE